MVKMKRTCKVQKGDSHMSSITLINPIMLPIIMAISFLFLANLIGRHAISVFDSTIVRFVQGYESPVLTTLMKMLTFIGSTGSVVVLSIIVLFIFYKILRYCTELYLFVFVLLATALSNIALKEVFKRTRPDLHQLIHETGYSFPSGHSMIAFAFYGTLAFLLWHQFTSRMNRMIVIVGSIIMILGIGISRIYLGVHYPSDVIGSYFASAFLLTIGIWFYQRDKEKS